MNLTNSNVFILEMETLEQSPACKAKIQAGPRKGEQCRFPPVENAYCGRHQRNYIYEKGLTEGKNWCRFFFRDCNELVEKPHSACTTCKGKKHEGRPMCKHEGCSHHTESGGFCKKHERDVYYIEEKEKNIKYCDIARGCFTICKGPNKSCDECLEEQRTKDKIRFDNRKILQNALKSVSSDKRICLDCGKEFVNYLTNNNHDSKRCNKCNTTVANQDKKRPIRQRNFKEEMKKNKVRYYKEYINGALKREYEFLLNFEEFSTIVDKECFYCNHNNPEEVNGIDRIDNSKGYIKENTVPCCEMCNRIKYIYHPIFFLEKCKIIGNLTLPNKEFYKKWSQYFSDYNHNYTNYKKITIEKRNMEFHITQAQWDEITRQQCYLCGYNSIGGIGLDRVNNSVREYTIKNVKPCCGSCNVMKCDFTLEEFKEKCKTVAKIWEKKSIDMFQNIQILKNESKSLQTKPGVRKVWKALGLYYTILNKEEEQFNDFYKEVLKAKELEELCINVRQDTKENALVYLSKFLQSLKDRRKRLALKNKTQLT